ncbi:hypothetical protein ABG067_007750 [Albugo candida]
MANNIKSQRKKTVKVLSEEEKQIRAEKQKTRHAKANKTYYQNKKRYINGSGKMHRFKTDVVNAIRLSNSDQMSLLLQFEMELVKWKSFVLGDGGSFTLLQSIILCYAYATTVITCNRFLEFDIAPRIVYIGFFSGAKAFFEKCRILFWRITAPPAQDLVNRFCSLSGVESRKFRPALVLSTALLVTFCSTFPFEEKYMVSFELREFLCGSGFGAGDEDDLEESVNDSTLRLNHTPTDPAQDEEFMNDEEDYGDLFDSDDEVSGDDDEEEDDSSE